MINNIVVCKSDLQITLNLLSFKTIHKKMPPFRSYTKFLECNKLVRIYLSANIVLDLLTISLWFLAGVKPAADN